MAQPSIARREQMAHGETRRLACRAAVLALLITAAACAPAAPPPPAPPEPGPEAGTVVVEAQPGGVEVVADGVARCRAPCRFRIAPGLHRVSIHKTGFMPWQENVEVPPNAEVKVSAALVASH